MPAWKLLFFAISLAALLGNPLTCQSLAAEPALQVCVANANEKEKIEFLLPDRNDRSIWFRELLRQSLLLSAREELGLPTCDVVLGEIPTVPEKEMFQVGSAVSLDKMGVENSFNTLRVYRGIGAKRTSLWEQRIPYTGFAKDYKYIELIQKIEGLSRTEFATALEKAGYEKRPRPRSKNSKEELPAELLQQIDEQLVFDVQFLALRQLHHLINTDGETRARLAGLVRVYANLGLLTEYHWHPLGTAFKARALLYAQRWVARDPKSAQAMWHRAYASTLIGLHGSALEDLVLAEKLAADAAFKPEPPGWVPLLEARCRFDLKQLATLHLARQHPQLTVLLEFTAYEQEGSHNFALTHGLKAIPDFPECYRIHDTLCDLSGVRAGHVTTSTAPMTIAATLLPRLLSAKSLPASAQEVLEACRKEGGIADRNGLFNMEAEMKAREKLVVALKTPVPADKQPDVAEAGEPAWSVLGQMISETSFLHVFRRAHFERAQLGLPADQFLDTFAPLVSGHPFTPFLKLYSTAGMTQNDFVAAVSALPSVDRHPIQFRLADRWPPAQQIPFRNDCSDNMSGLPNEIALAERPMHNTPTYLGHDPLKVSPHSPFGKVCKVFMKIKKLGDETAEWEADAEHYPFLAKTFAEAYMREGNIDKQEHFLRLAIKNDPSIDNYYQLANLYKRQQKDGLWLTTMKEFLEQPDFGLYHARVRVDISQYFAKRREWDRALPYSNAAAESFAQWALLDNWQVTEANQEWEASEAAIRNVIRRYHNKPVDWYYWCRRTGQGDLAAAQAALFPDGLDKLVPSAHLSMYDLINVLVLEGDLKGAFKGFEQQFNDDSNPWSGLQAAIIAEQLGDTKSRDSLLASVIEKGPAFKWAGNGNHTRPTLIALARFLRDDLVAGGKAEFDYEAVHKVRDASDPLDACNFNYFLACYLAQHGHEKEAIEYWKQCMGASLLTGTTRTQAGHELTKRKVKPEEWKALLFAPVKAK
ncbi:MAG TPA: hypothetical protein VL096_03400 [Pirellulaceae bacterium]|nr:hypothetical protein [Pirellulaceae bacterium]